MSSLIKSTALPDLRIGTEYVIDPLHRAERPKRHGGRDKPSSPDDQAASVIGLARQEADQMLSSALAEADRIRSEARSEGYESGLGELDRARQEAAERALQAEAELQSQLEQFWVEIEPELLSLSVEIAGKIIRHEVERNEQFVLDTVKSGLRQLRERRDLKIRVSPEDYEFIREHRNDVVSAGDGIRTVEFIDDRRIERGGCLIESGNGHLDGRIGTQLKEAERALMEAAAYGSSEDTAES